MITAKRLDGISEYYFASKLREIAALRESGQTIINLGIGSPDLPPAPEVIAALVAHSSLPNAHGYQGYTGLPVLRSAIADWYLTHYQVALNAADEILPLFGSKEGIMHIAMAFLQGGDQVLVPNPGYPSYRAASKLAGAEVVEYTLTESNDWLPDWDHLEAQDLSRVKIMWVNYPHMPTGKAGSKAHFERVVAFGEKHNILIVNDNPYSFILSDQPLSILSVAGAKDQCLELNSLSKSHNMAGWRVGMVSGAANLIKEVLRFKSNMDSGMFAAVQMAAVAALQLPSTWYEAQNTLYCRRQVVAISLLEQLGCTVRSGQQGLFVWAEIPSTYKDAYELSDALLYQCGVFLTPGGIFGSEGERYIRISLCSPEEVLGEAIEKTKHITF